MKKRGNKIKNKMKELKKKVETDLETHKAGIEARN